MEQRRSRDVRAATAPSASAIASTYDAHVDEVYRFVHRRCRDHSLAEDITQETFLTAIRRADDPSSISIALSSPASRDPGDKDMVFRPLSVFWSGADEGDPSGTGLADHLESLDGRVVVSNREDVTVDGRDAVRFDIEVDTSSCGADTEPCADLAPSESGLNQVVEVGWTQRIWVIEVGDDPVTVTASIWTDRDEVWLDVIERYVATMTFADEAS